MTAKQLCYREDARDKIRCGVDVIKREAPTSQCERAPLKDRIATLFFSMTVPGRSFT